MCNFDEILEKRDKIFKNNKKCKFYVRTNKSKLKELVYNL